MRAPWITNESAVDRDPRERRPAAASIHVDPWIHRVGAPQVRAKPDASSRVHPCGRNHRVGERPSGTVSGESASDHEPAAAWSLRWRRCEVTAREQRGRSPPLGPRHATEENRSDASGSAFAHRGRATPRTDSHGPPRRTVPTATTSRRLVGVYRRSRRGF